MVVHAHKHTHHCQTNHHLTSKKYHVSYDVKCNVKHIFEFIWYHTFEFHCKLLNWVISRYVCALIGLLLIYFPLLCFCNLCYHMAYQRYFSSSLCLHSLSDIQRVWRPRQKPVKDCWRCRGAYHTCEILTYKQKTKHEGEKEYCTFLVKIQLLIPPCPPSSPLSPCRQTFLHLHFWNNRNAKGSCGGAQPVRTMPCSVHRWNFWNSESWQKLFLQPCI